MDARPTRIDLADLPSRVGDELGVSDWFLIDQQRIDRFAQATDDHQWIHVDAARAAAGPFGATIAHGYLTLSLISAMSEQALDISGIGMSVNYGLGKVRFPAPVPSGSRVRGRFRLQSCEPIDGGGWQISVEATVEREGHPKPVCVAESLSRRYPAAPAVSTPG